MRKNAVRKWLHAILDLLPLFVIPIFAINIINRSPEPLTVEYDTTETETVVNYKYQSNVVSSADDLIEGNVYYLNGTLEDLVYDFELTIYSGYVEFEATDSPMFSGDVDFGTGIVVYPAYQYLLLCNNISINYDVSLFENIIFSFNDANTMSVVIENLFDDDYSVIQYTDFNVIESVETVTTGTVVTYNDTDIGSQFVYSMYHTVNNYFNFGNIFGMTGIYDWFVANFFNGNAPLVVPIIWNIIVYEFIMDILFIIYHLFMMLIDFTDYLLDKPFDSVKRKR